MRKLKFTKKGWLGLCPIYSTDDGRIMTRQDWYWWWLPVNSFLLFPVSLALGGEIMRITGELDEPVESFVYDN